MKKRFFLGAMFAGALTLLSGGRVFAASGNSATISGGTWDICVTAGSGVSYDGSSFVADIVGADISTQLVYGDFTTESCKTINLTVGNNYTVTMNKPMGVTSMSYTTASNKLTFSATPALKYLNIFGSQEQVVAASKVNISFNANGGTGVMNTMTNLDLNTSITLPANTVTKVDYRFAGWNTKADGSGTAYVDGATITLTTGGEVELFAQWAPDVALLDTGERVNVKLKKLAGATGSVSVLTDDQNIKAIKVASSLPAGFDTNASSHIISSSSSFLKIHSWFDDNDNDGDGDGDGIIYIYTTASSIRAGAEMGAMFKRLGQLEDISALADWDVSQATSMHALFEKDANLVDISALANWNTSNLRTMSDMLWETKITSADALETKQYPGNDYVSWDVSKVTTMSRLFYRTKLSDISALSSWNTSNVEDMSELFYVTELTDINALETKQYPGNDYVSWDVSKVTTMTNMLGGNKNLTDISPISNWDTSNVASMHGMFSGDDLSDISMLKPVQRSGYVSWDMDKVEYISFMFSSNKHLSDISVLEHWDTENVINMKGLFDGCILLQDISPLAKWNTSKVTDMEAMFLQTKITSLNALATTQRDGYVSWGVSKVTTMRMMFRNCMSLTDISALASWNTASVSILDSVFAYDYNITDISALADWDISNVTDMRSMFYSDTMIADLSALENWTVASSVNITNIFNGIPTSVTRPYWYHE